MKTKLIKTTTITIVFVLGIFLNTSVANVFGENKRETRNVGEFDGIGLAIPANLYLTQGLKNEVIIEAEEDVLEKIETEVNGSALNITFEKWYNYRGAGKINIFITVKNINSIVVSGSGDIIAKSAIKTESFDFVVSGSGSIVIDDLTVKDVHSVITGSGDVRIKGNKKANELEVTVTGSGDFEAGGLEFKEADLGITGSGSIYAFVYDELEAEITGSGKIYYKGNPLIDANITGSGKIRSYD